MFCKEGTKPKYFAFNSCNDSACRMFSKCNLRKTTKEAEGWIYKDDLFELLKQGNIEIDKKYIEYQNADYETVMYFYNNSFKGEVIEKMAMFQILIQQETKVFYGDDFEIKNDDIIIANGFLETLINSNVGDELVSFVTYIK